MLQHGTHQVNGAAVYSMAGHTFSVIFQPHAEHTTLLCAPQHSGLSMRWPLPSTLMLQVCS
jgi:hypothetical protein